MPAAASVLLVDLLADGGPLVEVARTRVSTHYETGRRDVPVLCVGTPQAVRLPSSVVTPVVPTGPLVVRDGALVGRDASWRVVRWWRPPRPHGLSAPVGPVSVPGVDVPAALDPFALVGAGEGLTPAGDDVLAGALVAASATGHPRLEEWRAATRVALRQRSTTAVSRALLTHALEGWATPELAAFLDAVCRGEDEGAVESLLAVGHSSGSALAAGALHVLGGPVREGAA
jgi:hypothetical protein